MLDQQSCHDAPCALTNHSQKGCPPPPDQLVNPFCALPHLPRRPQTLCMLRKAQDKGDDALALLKQSLELWHKPAPSEEEEEGAEDKEEDIEHSSEVRVGGGLC